MSVAYSLLTIFVVLLPVALFTAPAIRLWVLNRGWTPPGSARTPFVRRMEAGLLLLIALPLGLLWLFQGHDADLVPRAFSESIPEQTRHVLAWAVWLSAAGCLAAVLFAWRFSTSWASVLLVCGILVGNLYVQQVLSAQHREDWEMRHDRSEPKELADFPPMHVRFELPDNLAGADLWINGVHVGQTPYETTLQELLDQVPTWTHEEQRVANDEDRHETWTYDARGHHGSWLDRWGWCPLHLPSSIPHPHECLYYRVELGTLKGYSRNSNQRTEGAYGAPDTVTVYELDTRFPVWEDHIEELLDRARMTDYAVGPEWFAAFASYDSHGWDRLMAAIRTEPEFGRVLDDWARHEYGLHDVTGPDDAWQVLMRIREETRETREYASDDVTGRAVDLLVPELDAEQLTDYAIHLLETTPNPEPGSTSHGGDPPAFRTYRHGEPLEPNVAALWPIAHAVWRMDQHLDETPAGDQVETFPVSTARAADSAHAGGHNQIDTASLITPGRDNIIEREITPELLRMSYRNPGRLRYAALLGGSSLERFLLRQDWRAEPDVFTPGVQHIGRHENMVNPWFYHLMWLPGPAGQEFRRQNTSRLLELARDSVEDFDLMTGQLDGLDFLFLDREWSEDDPSLAMRFWPDVDRMAKLVPEHNHYQALRMRWDYLGRLWPESTIAMFVDAYAEQELKGRLFAVLPESIDPSDRAEIYSSLLDFEVERRATLPDDGRSSMQNPSYVSELNRQDLQQRLFDLPCEASAVLVLDQLQLEPGGPLRRNLPERMQVDTAHEDLVRLLAESAEPALQRMALSAIEHHPTPLRRAVLAGLLKAEDAETRAEASGIQRALEDFASRPLPQREIPDATAVTARASEAAAPTAP